MEIRGEDGAPGSTRPTEKLLLTKLRNFTIITLDMYLFLERMMNVKRFGKVLALFLTVLAVLPLFVFGAEAACAHSNAQWRVAVDSTCSAVGEKELFCVDCGMVVDTAVINKKWHNETSRVVEEGSNGCMMNQPVEGKKEHTCADCGNVRYEYFYPDNDFVERLGDTFKGMFTDMINAIKALFARMFNFD